MENLTYKIEDHKRDIKITNYLKCYIMMFKYEGSHWCFGLPVQNMYLQTLADVESDIKNNIIFNNSKGWECEYKIAMIHN